MTNEESWQWLKKRYPGLFNKNNVVPLAIGIRKQIEPELPEGFGAGKLAGLIKGWCSRKEYKNKLILGAARYGLDGNICGEVTKEHIDKANEKKDTRKR